MVTRRGILLISAQSPKPKKLLLVLATFMLVTGTKKTQKVRVLDQVPCIYYPMQFWKNQGKEILALLNFGSEVNAMTLAYTAQLEIKVQMTNVGTQKIDRSSLKTYNIVIATF